MAKITLQEETVTPSTPPASNQSFFFKADGLYAINSAGQVTGPFAVAAGFISGSYTLLDGRYQFSGTISTFGFVTGSYTLLNGLYQPSGTYITGSYTLLDGRYQATGTAASVVTGTYNLQFFMGNGVSVVSTGSTIAGYHYVEVPYASVVESWQLLADVTGSITINVLRSTNAGFPPTAPVAGLGQPVLNNQRKNSGNATGTVSLALQDLLLVEVVSASTVKITDLSLRARKV